MHQVTIGSHHLSPLMMTDVASGQLINGENQGLKSNNALDVCIFCIKPKNNTLMKVF